jgi:hypothetical protein
MKSVNRLLVHKPSTLKCNSVVSLLSSSNPSAAGQAVIFATGVGGCSPTGMVTFKDGTTVLGTINLNTAFGETLTTSSLATGSHSITASYGDDTKNYTSTSPTITPVVSSIISTTTAITSSKNPWRLTR